MGFFKKKKEEEEKWKCKICGKSYLPDDSFLRANQQIGRSIENFVDACSKECVIALMKKFYKNDMEVLGAKE